MRLPRMSPISAASKSGTAASAEVEILRVVPRHRPQHDRRVAHRLRQRPGLVERRGEGDDAPARAAPVGRLHPDDPGEGRRLADRAAGIGARRAEAEIRRHRRRRPAGRPARRQRRRVPGPPPGAHRRAIDRGLVRAPHGELVHVELADADRSRLPELPRHRALVGRPEPLEDPRGRLRRLALDAEEILDPERHAAKVRRVARLEPRRGRGRLTPRQLRRAGAHRVQRAGGRRPRRGTPRSAPPRRSRRRAARPAPRRSSVPASSAIYSTTFGTVKKPSRAAGAFASTRSRRRRR